MKIDKLCRNAKALRRNLSLTRFPGHGASLRMQQALALGGLSISFGALTGSRESHLRPWSWQLQGLSTAPFRTSEGIACDPRAYLWAALRGVHPIELIVRLNRVEQDVLDRPNVVKLALDDLEFGNLSAIAADAIARIVQVLGTRNGSLLITTSTDPSARMLETLGVSARNFVRLGADGLPQG